MPFGPVLLVMVHVVLPWKALLCCLGRAAPTEPQSPRAPACTQPAWRNTEHTGTDAGKIQKAGAGL